MTAEERRWQWRDAVWDSCALTSTQKLVALAHEKYAGRAGIDDVWLTWAVLGQMTGLSRASVGRAVKELRAAGWLVETTPARRHDAPHFSLRIPQQGSQRETSQRETPHPETSRTPRGLTREPERSHRATQTAKEHLGAAAAPQRRSRTTAETLAEHGITAEKDLDDFQRFLHARSLGAVVATLVKSGQLEERVTEWRRGRRTSGTSPWDRRPNVTDLRLAREAAEREAAASGTPTVPYQQWWDR